MNTQHQVSIIQNVLRSSKQTEEVNEYEMRDKLEAITNYFTHNEQIAFDMSFVNKIYDVYFMMGKLSKKQIDSVDNIISVYKIDVDTWS